MYHLMVEHAKDRCVDCIREGVLVPKLKATNQSYCTHHVYIRTIQSRSRVTLRSIINEGHWSDLQDRKRDGSYRWPIQVLGAEAKKLRDQAEEVLAYMHALELPRPEQVPYKEEALNLLTTAACLTRRRELNTQELYEISLQVDGQPRD